MAYLKPQSPLKHKDGDYIYPLTTVDQVIVEDGSRLNATLDNCATSEEVTTAVANKQNKHTTATVTLSASGWSNNSQTVSVTGVTATNTVFTTHAPSGYITYRDCGVRMSAQSAGKLTFACESVPTENITVNIAIFN